MNGHAIGLTGDTTIADWLHLIRAEYAEVPGLHLTKPQVQDLWALDPWVCDALLIALVDDGFLRRTSDGAYVRPSPPSTADLDKQPYDERYRSAHDQH